MKMILSLQIVSESDRMDCWIGRRLDRLKRVALVWWHFWIKFNGHGQILQGLWQSTNVRNQKKEKQNLT